MGEYFKDKNKKKEPEEEVFIKKIPELFSAYDVLKHKIDDTKKQGYEMILPFRLKLFGERQGASDMGSVGKLMTLLDKSWRLKKLEIGQLAYSISDEIKDLDNWSERYAEFLEGFVTELQFLCRSSFLLLKGHNEEIQRLKQELEKSKTDIRSGLPYEALDDEEKKELRKQFDYLFSEYIKSNKMAIKKANISKAAKGHPEKRRWIDKWFREESLKLDNQEVIQE